MKHYALADKGREKGIVAQIMGGDEPVNAGLYRAYAENLRKAVGMVYAEGGPEADRFKANLSRFAAYKAWHATRQVREKVREADGDTEAGTKVLHAFNRWQAAEYNTAVARCRTAKQWDAFAQDDNMRLFPNIRWLTSRSATPRELHAAFWNRVWPKDDPFWDHNQPGNLWNCKCDWDETDDPPTDGNPKAAVKHDGLEGNPAKTGEIFSDNASYIRKAGEITLDKETAKSLPNLQKLLDADTRRWRIDYYTDTDGTLYTSRERIGEGKLNKQEKAKFDKEHVMCRTLADNGHRVYYRESVEGSFDIFMDGKPTDLKKVSSHNNIVKYAKKAVNKQGAEIVVFEFEEINSHIIEELKKLDKMKIPYVYFVSTDKSTVIKSTTR